MHTHKQTLPFLLISLDMMMVVTGIYNINLYYKLLKVYFLTATSDSDLKQEGLLILYQAVSSYPRVTLSRK